MWQAWEAVGELAAEDGVELAESELIGLAPLAALLDVADHAGAPGRRRRRAPPRRRRDAIRLRDFSPLMALELRLGPRAPRRPAGGDGVTLRLIEGGRSDEPTPRAC